MSLKFILFSVSYFIQCYGLLLSEVLI